MREFTDKSSEFLKSAALKINFSLNDNDQLQVVQMVLEEINEFVKERDDENRDRRNSHHHLRLLQAAAIKNVNN